MKPSRWKPRCRVGIHGWNGVTACGASGCEVVVSGLDFADERAWHLASRGEETCEVLCMDGVEPLGCLNAIRLHILINVLLKSAAAVDEDIEERQPIRAVIQRADGFLCWGESL